jgi:putative nucleotidyltransferase with HDIG domain
MARIIVVEDEDYFREALVGFLSSKGHQLSQAPNGKVAKTLLASQEVDIILSDVQMPYCDGIELLQWVQKEHPTSFILMTGFTNLLETKSAFDLGAEEFLAKPFRNEELLQAIKNILDRKNPAVRTEEPRNIVNEFCKVSIDEFVARPNIEFDVYVRLSETKYIKIGHSGDLIPTDRIKTYREKGVEFLHIKKEDFSKLVGFNVQVMKLLGKDGDIAHEKKLNFMKYTGEAILEKAFIAGVDEASFNEAKDFLNTTVGVIADSGESFDLLKVLNEHSDFIYAHSLGVSMYAMMIARRMGFTSSQVFFKLSMAGMFHDVGKKEIPREILEKARPLLSQKERAEIETHPTRGKEILSFIKNVPSDVVQIVYEHHEDCIGQGYPRRIAKNELHPLSKILITANLFVENALKGPNNEGMSSVAAIKHIETIYGERIDKACLQALKMVFPASLA